MQPTVDTIVKIVPRCFHFDGTENASQDVKRSSVKTKVHAIVNINLSDEERTLALKQVVLDPLVRSIAKEVLVLLMIMNS